MRHAVLRGLAALALSAASLSAQTPCGTFEVLDMPFDDGWDRALFEEVDMLPDGLELFAQVWIADGSNAAGFAASNGLVAVSE